jgi:two-component system chemotaxis response regulator CheB
MADEPGTGTHAPLVVVGASAGGVDALTELVRGLPADLPAPVLIVLHVAPSSPSLLPRILNRSTEMAVAAALDGDALESGHVYVAPPDQHLVVEDGVIRLQATATVNGHRPAVDPLFTSAAAAYGGDVVGVILSGTRDDGTAGLAEIKAQGGTTIVQDPDTARYAGMPLSAIDNVHVDAILALEEIGPAIASVCKTGKLPDGLNATAPVDDLPDDRLASICPECGGVLLEHDENGVAVFRCHVGHSYGPRTLADMQGTEVERALWTAVRMLEDRQALLRRLAEQSTSREQIRSARRFTSQADEATRQADTVRAALRAFAESTGLGDPLPAQREEENGTLRLEESA